MGRITKLNKKANRKLKEQFQEACITYCEKCGSMSGLTFAHRHKRLWYRSCPEKLWDMNEVALLCLKCHQEIEYNRALSERVFDTILKRRSNEFML